MVNSSDEDGQIMDGALEEALHERQAAVLHYLDSSPALQQIGHGHLDQAIRSYLKRPGKKLRPAVLLLSAGAVGGDESAALPAAAGIELFHTWTLVHDDLIDNDALRRGGPSVHEEIRRVVLETGGYSSEEAEDYGRNIAILAGDVQHGWAVRLFAECAGRNGVSADVALTLIKIMESRVINNLAWGESLDIEYARRPLGEVTLEDMLLMLQLKTGNLYEFAAQAGAMLGLNSPDDGLAVVKGLAEFGSLCGTAFQLQDDILGIIGDEQTIGKPVGNDIREGKRTPIVYFAWQNADRLEKAKLASVLGNGQATQAEIAEAREMLVELGGVEEASKLAGQWLERGLRCLEVLPPTAQRELLGSLARYMIARSV